ncbi:MAG TPA: hypothetical protein VGG57_18635 [Stellaceae bacterium]|jgi:hypothetical protein
MRIAIALIVLPVLFSGCTPYIPTKPDFGTSALAPAGDTPPEFAEFNGYDAARGPLVADQICATPYTAVEQKTVDAAPGTIITGRGTCQDHVPLVGSGNPMPPWLQNPEPSWVQNFDPSALLP